MVKTDREGNIRNSNKGITLIALVITIIVLLILAGVSIAMLTGPNGLLTQAKDAKIKTDEAEAKEKVQIAVAGSWGENGFDTGKFGTEVGRFDGKITSEEEEFPIKVSVDGQNFEVSEEGVVTQKGADTPTTPDIPSENTIKPGEKVSEEKGNTEYKNNGTAIIPVGFSIVPGLDDVSQGLVISDDANDTEEDKNHIIANGNQFVWIPVTDTNSYVRKPDYPKADEVGDLIDDEGYLPTFNEGEKEPDGSSETDKEKNLVISKGGFYISRYEAGDSSVEADRTTSTDGTLVSKKDAYVYTWIKQTEAKEKAKTFINDKNVKSGLITGIQWDMVMTFISQETRKDGNGEDNYSVTEYNSTRHHSSGVEKSGQNEADRVCNIYDLEGNCLEYVAEINSTSLPYVRRGGYYSAPSRPASWRNVGTDYACDDRTFRFVLYVM